MNPETNLRFVQLAQRAMFNHDYIFKLRGDSEPPYEVTQLIISLVGIFVWTKEAFLTKGKTEWAQLTRQLEKREIPEDITQNKGKLSNYKEFFVYLRHAIAHGNFKFGEDDYITEITVWNYPPRSKTKNWQAEIPVKTLVQLARWAVYDLNAAAFETFGNGDKQDNKDIEVYSCECGFLWIGKDKPDWCIGCFPQKPLQWSKHGTLNISSIKKWGLMEEKQ